MSLIYKSLQQLKKEDERKKIKPKLQSPQAVSSGLRTILVRAVAIVIVAGALTWGASAWIRSELKEIMLANARQTTEMVRIETRAPAPESTPETTPEIMINELPDIQEVALTPPRTVTQARVTSKKILPASGPQKPQPVKKKSALQNHFANQAKKNQRLLQVSNNLKTAIAKPEGQKYLKTLNKELGPKNIFNTKWQGYQALKNKDYPKAESLYKKVLQSHSGDRESRINLILALLGQNKKSEARTYFNGYVEEYPTDQNALRLRKAFD